MIEDEKRQKAQKSDSLSSLLTDIQYPLDVHPTEKLPVLLLSTNSALSMSILLSTMDVMRTLERKPAVQGLRIVPA
jgi:hypothetical protein